MGVELGGLLEGKYRIERVLGRGGMGTVYEAVHTRIHRRVAVKVLKAAMAADDEMVQRFEREALAASSVSSPHVVQVFDVGQLDSGERYMILEFLDGESLSERLKRLGTMSPSQLFPLAIQMLEGLQAAHDAGIVHRDLKPANVFLAKSDDGEIVKVLDFGVSKFAALAGDGFTQTGTIVGTPHYMAAEQTKGARHADARSDVYSAGAIMFRALTGRPPFLAETIHELIAKLISTEAPKIATVAPAVAPSAAALVDRALDKIRERRFESARAMKDELQAWLDTASPASLHGAAPPVLDADELPTIATPSSTATEVSASSLSGAGPWPSAASSGASAADPATLLTPSPSILDSGALVGGPQDAEPRRGWLPLAALGVIAATVAAIAVLTSGGKPQAPPAAAATMSAPEPTADEPPDEPTADPSPAEAEPEEPAETASAEVEAMPPTPTKSASPKPRVTKPPPKPKATTPPPKPKATPPKAQPKTTPPPGPDGRDFREDI